MFPDLYSKVKVQGQNEEMLHAATQQFLGKTEREIHNVALETLVSLLLKITIMINYMWFIAVRFSQLM